MRTVLILNIIILFFSFLARYERYRWSLKISFSLIFIFLALRYNYGNDYSAYLNIFNIVSNYSSMQNLFDGSIYGEPGWLILCRLFKPIGFFALVAILALINCIVYYRLIANFVSPKFYWFAVFIYVFTPGMMLIHLSTMRQSLAITIFLISINFLIKKKIILYLISIFFASFFHASALLMLPIYLLRPWNWKLKKLNIIIISLIYISIFVFEQKISILIAQFISNKYEQYSLYIGGQEVVWGSGAAILFNFLMLILSFYYINFQSEKTIIFFKLGIIYFLLFPLILIIPMFARPGMYLAIAILVMLPMTFYYVKNKVFLYAIMALFILYTLIDFKLFFQSETWQDSYRVYQTIFSAPEFY